MVVARTCTVGVQTLWAKDCGGRYERERPRKNEARIADEMRSGLFIVWVMSPRLDQICL